MRILVLAPHPDDEVLGVGGTITKYVKDGHEVYVCIVTSVDDSDLRKIIQSEAKQAHNILGIKETIYLNFPVVRLRETSMVEMNKSMLDVVDKIKPEIAFIPHKGDMHADHAEVAKSAMVALRPINNPQLKAIYAYETLSETEWNIPSADNLFVANVWNDISDSIDIKKEAMACYKSQLKDFPHPRSLKAIEALSEYRGSTICVRNAECFMLLRNIL